MEGEEVKRWKMRSDGRGEGRKKVEKRDWTEGEEEVVRMWKKSFDGRGGGRES